MPRDNEPRFWVHDTVGHDGFSVFDRVGDTKLADVPHDTMSGIVDEEDGGIVAYALSEALAESLVERLNRHAEEANAT